MNAVNLGGGISQVNGQIYHHPFYSPLGGPKVKYTITPFTLPPWGTISQCQTSNIPPPLSLSPLGGPSHRPTVKYTTTPFTHPLGGHLTCQRSNIPPPLLLSSFVAKNTHHLMGKFSTKIVLLCHIKVCWCSLHGCTHITLSEHSYIGCPPHRSTVKQILYFM